MLGWFAVAAGGALGSMARHAVSQALPVDRFPAATVIVNLSGCFIIGLLAGLTAAKHVVLPMHWREFVFAGILGGFTTFSTFGLDTFLLARTHAVGYAFLNVAVQVLGGLAAVWLGYRISN